MGNRQWALGGRAMGNGKRALAGAGASIRPIAYCPMPIAPLPHCPLPIAPHAARPPASAPSTHPDPKCTCFIAGVPRRVLVRAVTW